MAASILSLIFCDDKAIDCLIPAGNFH